MDLSNEWAPAQKLTAQQLIQNFIDAEYDLAEMEGYFTDLLLHFLRPTDDSVLDYDRAREIVDKGVVFLDLLRGMRAMQAV